MTACHMNSISPDGTVSFSHLTVDADGWEVGMHSVAVAGNRARPVCKPSGMHRICALRSKCCGPLLTVAHAPSTPPARPVEQSGHSPADSKHEYDCYIAPASVTLSGHPCNLAVMSEADCTCLPGYSGLWCECTPSQVYNATTKACVGEFGLACRMQVKLRQLSIKHSYRQCACSDGANVDKTCSCFCISWTRGDTCACDVHVSHSGKGPLVLYK